ncbi:XIAP-associated factor 1 isoform X2 [Ailuropoda melanoleuca]|nr:XIAP-associated factor 1 isoform X2 [Ailuropoda melanoleuca]
MEEWWQDRRQQATERQERPAEHEFCELAVRLNQLEVHGHRCGGRTGLRPDHGQPVRRQVLAQHREVCGGEPAQRRTGKKFPAPKSRIYCLYCNQMIPKKQFFRHTDKCCSVPEPMKCLPTGKPRTPPAPLPTQTSSDQTCYAKDVRPKMNNRHRFPPPSENSTKQAAHGTNSTLTLPLKPEHKRRGPSAARHEAAYDVLRRCSLCGILLPLPILNQHQERCWWLASRKGNHARNSS